MRRLPLTPLQSGLVRASLHAPESGSYVLQNILELPERVNSTVLQQAWKQVAARHTILRASVEGTNAGDAWLEVHDQPQTCWTELDWSGVPAEEAESRLATILEQDRRKGFDFQAGPPLRFLFIRHGSDRATLVWTYHHVLLDGRSVTTVFREWFVIYEALLAGEEACLPPVRPFEEHIEWIGQQDLGAAEQFWTGELAGLAQTAGFVQERFRPSVAAHAHAESPFLQAGFSLSKELTQRLTRVARDSRGTLTMIVLGAWALLLNRYSGADDVVFGVVHTTRPPRWGRESAVGPCINTLPLRVRIDPDASLTDWLRRLTAQWRSIRAYRWAPSDRVREWGGLAPGRLPFDSVVVYDTQSPQDQLRSLGGNWSRRNLRRKQRTDLPLTLGAYGSPALTLQIGYDARLYSQETVIGLVHHLRTLLESIATQPDTPVGALPMLPEEEHQQILREWNRTATVYPRDLCAHELIEEQARRVPDRPALERGAETTSYAEVNRRANQLARLLRNRGAAPESMVAVCADHTPAVAIAILAVLQGGRGVRPAEPASSAAATAGDAGDNGGAIAAGKRAGTRGSGAGERRRSPPG